jgi:hypothetical protein
MARLMTCFRGYVSSPPVSVRMPSVGAMQIMERVRSWLEPSDAEEQAEAVFRSLWDETARAESTRHPFHREVLTDLDVLLDKVAVAAPDTLVRVNGITIRWDAVPQRYPHISRRLTTDWIRSFVVEEVARVQWWLTRPTT